MDLSFTESQQAIRSVARDLLESHTTQDRLRQAEAGPDRFDRALWAELARGDLLGVGIPEALGGIGGDLVDVCVLLEQIGRTTAPVPALHAIATGTLPIARFAPAEMQSELLPRIASGDLIVTAALSDARPAATREGDSWTLSGRLDGVPSASISHAIVVASDAGLFLVETDGLAMGAQRATDGEPLARIELDSTPARLVTLEPSAGDWLRRVATVAWCAVCVGACDRAVRITAEYLTSREQFGRPLATFQAVQQRIADAYIDVEAMRWTMWQAASLLAAGHDAGDEVTVAKFWAAEGGQRVVSAAQHLHGGIGVDVEYGLSRYTTLAKRAELALGSAAPQLALLGDRMAESVR